MKNKFAEIIENETFKKVTENGAMAYSSTQDDLLDLFATAGALRSRPEEDIIEKFKKAFAEDALLTTKMLFHTGNIRGGLGERRTFRTALKWMASTHPEWVEMNMHYIPYFNRWDSIFQLLDTPVEDSMWELISSTLISDLDNAALGNSISLLAKWLPSPKTASAATRALARRVRFHLGLSEKEYRKILSALRMYLDVVEVKMSARKWEDIDFSIVPSYAMKNYAEAFKRHCGEKWEEYITKVETGEEKIIADTLYPYDLVGQIRKETGNERVIEAQWKALPDYLDGDDSNILVMADVSGSMNWAAGGRPMNTSIGLAIYFAQRNKGAFQNLYMTFSDKPHFLKVDPECSLKRLVRDVENRGIGYNTNLEAAFDKILELLVQNKVTQEDVPKALVVISDMEIDMYVQWEGLDFVDTMKSKFERCGYTMPQLVCWNVEARQDTFLTQGADTLVVGGQSASVFKNIIDGLGKTAYELMIDTLNDPLYRGIQAPDFNVLHEG